MGVSVGVYGFGCCSCKYGCFDRCECVPIGLKD